MNEIKVDVNLVLEQSKIASDALENVDHCIKQLQSKYSDYLSAMESNEFIDEFEESIEELIDQTEELSDQAIKQIIDGLATISETIEEVDAALSNL